MRKLIIIAVTLFMATNVFAQEVVEVIGVQWRPEGLGLYDSGKYDGSTVYFSNGQSLRYSVVVTVFGKVTRRAWFLFDKDQTCSYVTVNFPVAIGSDIVGQKFQKRYNTYTRVSLQKVGTYTIKKVSVHEVTSEFTASMNGDYSYKWAHVLIAGGGKAKGSVSGSAKGGPRTIVNIFFENGKKATIEASEDPIWLDAEPGMQAEHYQLGDKNFYNLL